MDKKEARALIRARLKQTPAQELAEADQLIRQRLLGLDAYQKAGTVFCYVSFGQELDTRPLLQAILADGKRLAAPLILGPGLMEAREILDLSQLEPGAFGISTPPETAPAIPQEELELALVPGLAFDQGRWRLGRGGGYYDRWLAAYSGISLGLAREIQMLDGLPHDEWDCRVQLLLTEQRLFQA